MKENYDGLVEIFVSAAELLIVIGKDDQDLAHQILNILSSLITILDQDCIICQTHIIMELVDFLKNTYILDHNIYWIFSKTSFKKMRNLKIYAWIMYIF